MQTVKIILGLGMAISLIACSKGENEQKSSASAVADRSVEEMVTADSVSMSFRDENNKDKVVSTTTPSYTTTTTTTGATGAGNSTSTENRFISSSAAVENGKDTTRKFVRTANLKFKVKSVINSTYDIEAITTRHSGFVTYTNLTSNIENVSITAISADSSLETTKYVVVNSITLRVPNTKLDTALKDIAKNIDYLDYRIIKADDIALQLLSNSLTQKRATKQSERLENAIDNRGKKLRETSDAEELLNNTQAQADNAKISNLSLKDQINFSTVSLIIYQRETIRRELIPNDKNIAAYEPGFGTKLFDALKDGLYVLSEVFIFLVEIWWLILLGVAGYFVWRKYKK